MKNNQRLIYVGIFILGALITWGLTQNKIIEETSDTSSTYGTFGYGRGNSTGGGRNSTANQSSLNKENCLMDGCLLVEDSEYPVAELSQETIGYLEAGLADERKAHAVYEVVIEKFGSVRPFINILRAEEQHQAMLKALFDKYGVEIPADNTPIQTAPTTLIEACQIGVDAEIENDALYQDMLPNIEEEDIIAVFNSLADASRLMHLPAFERCAN